MTVFKFSNISAIPFECFCLGMTRFGIGEDTHKLLRGCFCTTNQASESLQIELEAVESKLRRANAHLSDWHARVRKQDNIQHNPILLFSFLKQP